MNEVQIRTTLKNSENETTNLETKGVYDIEKNMISYVEDDLNVSVYINSTKIIMSRKNENYNLNLEFELNKQNKSKYEVKSVGLYIDLIVETKKLIINRNSILIQYELYNDEKIIGAFEYELYWE